LSIRKKTVATGVRFGMRISLDLPVGLIVEARTVGRAIGIEWCDMAGADIVELLQRASGAVATY